MNETIEIPKEWIMLDKYNFKILVLIVVLADNNRAFRGKISEFCNELCIQSSSRNMENIKNSLQFLEQQGYIKIIQDKLIYTITLSDNANKNKKIISIKKIYYKLLKDNYNRSWENILKVFMYLLDLDINDNIRTYKEIAEETNCSVSTIKNAVKRICSIEFPLLSINKEVIKEKYIDCTGEKHFFNVGTRYEQGIAFR